MMSCMYMKDLHNCKLRLKNINLLPAQLVNKFRQYRGLNLQSVARYVSSTKVYPNYNVPKQRVARGGGPAGANQTFEKRTNWDVQRLQTSTGSEDVVSMEYAAHNSTRLHTVLPMQPVGFRLTHLYYFDLLIRLLTVFQNKKNYS